MKKKSTNKRIKSLKINRIPETDREAELIKFAIEKEYSLLPKLFSFLFGVGAIGLGFIVIFLGKDILSPEHVFEFPGKFNARVGVGVSLALIGAITIIYTGTRVVWGGKGK